MIAWLLSELHFDMVTSKRKQFLFMSFLSFFFGRSKIQVNDCFGIIVDYSYKFYLILWLEICWGANIYIQ